MTEFEKGLNYFLRDWIQRKDDYRTVEEAVKESSKKLLDLARKELEKDNVIIDKDRYLKICDQYYNNGKKNALKDLPKWKKITDETNLSLTLSNGEYYLPLEDLEKLPKEE